MGYKLCIVRAKYKEKGVQYLYVALREFVEILVTFTRAADSVQTMHGARSVFEAALSVCGGFHPTNNPLRTARRKRCEWSVPTFCPTEIPCPFPDSKNVIYYNKYKQLYNLVAMPFSGMPKHKANPGGVRRMCG
jgi:hypothetical protein